MRKLCVLIVLLFAVLPVSAQNRRTFVVLQDNSGSYNQFPIEYKRSIQNKLIGLFGNNEILDDYSLISRETSKGIPFFDTRSDALHFFWFVADQANNVDFFYRSNGAYDVFESYFLTPAQNYTPQANVEDFFIDVYGQQPSLSSAPNGHGISTYSFTSYAYPLCLDVLPMAYSKEYIVILISDFKAGSTFGNKQDEKIFKDAFRHKANDVIKRVAHLNSQFVKIDLGDYYIDAGDRGIIGFYAFKIRPNAGSPNPENIEVRIDSDIHLEQNSFEGDIYTLNPTKIVFNHADNLLIDKVYVDFLLPTGETVRKDVTSSMRESNGVFSFASVGDITLPGITNSSIDGLIDLTYVFDTSFCIDGENKQAIKYTFETRRTIDNTNFTFQTQLSTMEISVIIVVILVVLSSISFWMWKRRGRKCKTTASIKIGTVSNERFLRVKDSKVTNLDCWYWDGKSNERGITVNISLEIEQPKFSKKYRYVLEAKVEDLDANYDFSFRPNPSRHHAPQGGTYSADDWVPIDLNDLKFHVVAYLDTRTTEKPNFDIDNIVKMGVSVRLKRILDNGTEENIVLQNGENRIHEVYTFIIRPKLDNSNLWMAFDPGTSGSCIAYGVAGSPTDTNDLFVAQNTAHSLTGSNIYTSVFPSRVRISRDSIRLASDEPIEAESLVEGVDFEFGNRAEILWGNFNCFQSIKKLLGYENSHKILIRKNGKDTIKDITGKDLAHLLVKGLCNHFDKFITENPGNRVDRVVREQFLAGENSDSKSPLAVERAIVAVPNSYTLDKIQEMVDSVARTNRFKEVHYIYESEAVFMTYLRANWSQIGKLQRDRIFVVYDMGGATINITAFKLKVDLDYHNNVDRVYVTTLSKIGYTIGGDDVDFALIQMIYNIPTVRDAIASLISDQDRDTWDSIALQHQQANKDRLLKFVREVKLDIITYFRTDDDSERQILKIQAPEVFYGHVIALFKEMGVYMNEMPSQEVIDYLQAQNNECVNKHGGTSMQNYVLKQVRDAIDELIKIIPADEPKKLELIFSGRSVLYPNIKDNVYQVIRAHNYNVTEWDGLKENGVESSELVKTAVAKGACWFAMYNSHIRLDHSILTTTLGFIDNESAQDKFIPLLTSGTHFEDGYLESEKVAPIYSRLRDVKFVQMMGANYDTIWRSDLSHKYSLMARQRQDVIIGDIEYISMSANDCGEVECAIKLMMQADEMCINLAGAMRLDITDDNSPAYIFATTNTSLETYASGGKTDLYEVLSDKTPKTSRRTGTGSKRI